MDVSSDIYWIMDLICILTTTFIVQAYCQTYFQEILTVVVLSEHTGNISLSLGNEIGKNL